MKTDRQYCTNLEEQLRAQTKQIVKIWGNYKDAKIQYWKSHLAYIELSGDAQIQVNIFYVVALLIFVYFIDFIFSYQVVQFFATSQLHNWWLIHAALILFPLGWIVVEMTVNHFTHCIKEELDNYPRDRSRKRAWIFWVIFSVCLAFIMPSAYVATALPTMTDLVFQVLAIVVAMMVASVHIIIIFAGSQMASAKKELISWWQNRRKFRGWNKFYRQIVNVKTDLEGLYADYLRKIEEICNQGDFYAPIPLPPLVRYIFRYVDQDYHHLPPGNEPQSGDDGIPLRLGSDR